MERDISVWKQRYELKHRDLAGYKEGQKYTNRNRQL